MRLPKQTRRHTMPLSKACRTNLMTLGLGPGRGRADGCRSRTAESQNLHLLFAQGHGLADRLETALKARGFEPLIDRTEIYAFEDWWKRIEALIARADTVVFVLSPDAIASEVAQKEVAHAASLNKRFAPRSCAGVPTTAAFPSHWAAKFLG